MASYTIKRFLRFLSRYMFVDLVILIAFRCQNTILGLVAKVLTKKGVGYVIQPIKAILSAKSQIIHLLLVIVNNLRFDLSPSYIQIPVCDMAGFKL